MYKMIKDVSIQFNSDLSYYNFVWNVVSTKYSLQQEGLSEDSAYERAMQQYKSELEARKESRKIENQSTS